MSGGDIIGLTTANRTGVSSVDSANQATFKAALAAASRIYCRDMAEVHVHGRTSAASATLGIRVAWYDIDDAFLYAEDERTFTADANEESGASPARYLTQTEKYGVPGAAYARLWLRTAVSSGTADLYAGALP